MRHDDGYLMLNSSKNFYIGEWHDDLMHGREKMLYNFMGSYDIYEG
jgi:hypothetical protein